MDLYEGAFEKIKDVESKRENPDLDDFEEFMRKVEEVNKMVHALTSSNKAEYEEASKKASAWLKNQKKGKSDDKELLEEIINEPTDGGNHKKKINKTVINENALKDEKTEQSTGLDNLNCNEMSQEAFMKSVEEDAKKRSEDRRQRKAESDVIKAEASKMFAAKDYEKALDLYNKAIEVRKDSYVLYNNRALTLLNLGLNNRALNDCETALKLNETNFKAAALKAKAYFQLGEDEKKNEWMEEVRKMFPDRVKEMEEYEASWSEETE
ncbi:hypothetical protein RUM43_014226 [Polyplax serrata]|uniref:Uncharacterized protein n=1 Tax=Polyplax serrata TaxID=468196 RepID=A0AAN8S6U5_POLSC